MNAVKKDLSSLQQPLRTNNDFLLFLAIQYAASAYGNIRSALSYFDASSMEIWTDCLFYYNFPLRFQTQTYWHSIKLKYSGHKSLIHLSSASCKYSFERSMPTDFLSRFCATYIVVPVPQNGSRTIPSGGQVATIGILHKSAGYGAKCSVRFCVSSGKISHTSPGLLPSGWYTRK